MPRLVHNVVSIRRGFSSRKLLAALVLVLALPAIGFSLWPRFSWSTTETGPMMYRVARGQFLHEVTNRGNVQSAKNVEVKCQVRSRGGGGIMILEVAPEGKMVQPGDVLVLLDSSELERNRTSQLIVCANSQAALIQAQRVYDTAVIAKKEYTQGTYMQSVKTAENENFVAQEELTKAQDYLAYSKRLAAKGYITALQLRADEFTFDKAKNARDIAETKLEVLKNFTNEKTLIQLEADIKTAEARLEAQQQSHDLDMAYLKLIESQIEQCTIRAPSAGQVVYANETDRHLGREIIIQPGETVRERQVLIRLPDSKNMQVVARVNEGKITQVKVGMPADIRLDAFPELELHGTVQKVNEFPVPSGWWGSSAKEYETTVQILESPPGLRPGLTAEVRICIENTPDMLQVPVQAVFEHGARYYSVVEENGRWTPREVNIGSTNDKTVVVQSGLAEGEEVVLNAAAYREKVDLPELPLEEQRALARARGSARSKGQAADRRDMNRNGPQRDAEEAAQLTESLLRQHDSDGDGKLRLADLLEELQSRLQTADVNGDGFVDRGELAAIAGSLAAEAGERSKTRSKEAVVVDAGSR